MRIFVKAKKDRDALLHVNAKYYHNGLDIRAMNVTIYQIKDFIEQIKGEDFTIVLLGKDDAKYLDSIEELERPWLKVQVLKKSKVRHTKPDDLKKEIEEAKFRFIMDVYYKDGVYLLGKKSNFIQEFKFGSDVYLAYGKAGEEFQKFLGSSAKYFVHHEPGVDNLYVGKTIIGRISRSMEFWYEKIADSNEPIKVEETFIKNKKFVEEKVKIVREKIKTFTDTEDKQVIVPWSGGKDSTFVLLLAKEVLRDFTAVFVDTGGEFKENLEYIERMEKKLNIPLEIVKAPVAENYEKQGPEFLTSRLCTRIKISSLYEFIRRNFENPIILVGDRISESESRSFSPELKRDEFLVFSPVKYFSFLEIQTYFYNHNIEQNPLYMKGFYRIGCTFCPFLDAFERIIVHKKS